MTRRRMCVFCDSSFGRNPQLKAAAVTLGHAMAAAGIGLVFGGGAEGTMGLVAQTVKAHGGHVTGILAQSPSRPQEIFCHIDESHTANDLQEGKRLMFELADGFVALPGGVIVLDALMEHLTWMHRGHRAKPVYLLNTAGYWDLLLQTFRQMRDQKFLPRDFQERYVLAADPADVIARFEQRVAS
jgi:uncharacterized protein (TIGR00730 family)